MAAFCRQVLDCCRLFPLTWARVARETPCLGERKTVTVPLLRKLTTASGGGDLEELSCVGSNKYVKEPECRMNLVQCLLEKQRTPEDRGSLELEKVTSSLLDMGFSDAHINELLSMRPGANPQQLLDIISEFILLGLNPEPVCVALKRSPQLLKLSIRQMKKRSIYLRKLGLGEEESGLGKEWPTARWIREGFCGGALFQEVAAPCALLPCRPSVDETRRWRQWY
uniref:Mitochondrial transcription termination factor 4 n=1 Tax=Propithecus coquereli TaxID=379532 RepID=A0A2K6EZZ7_PROCO